MLNSALSMLSSVASASMVTDVMRSFVTPVVITLSAIASLACVFFLIMGGVQYMSSTGNPEKLGRAKVIIKNALVGMALVLASTTVTAILSNSYSESNSQVATELPALQEVKDIENDSGVTDVLVNAIVGLLRKIVNTAAQPFLEGLSYFTHSTPLMAKNPNVFNLWLAIVGLADVLFVLVVALLGFHIMSFATFGFEELDIRHLIPRMALTFLLINTSIFGIDALVTLSNAMIHALQSGFQSTDIWATLLQISEKSADMGIAGLLVLVGFLVAAVMLLVYYLMRLVALYLGAILSPLVVLLWLIPAFRDFAVTAFKTYATAIFVLFVHTVIMLLAASILTGLNDGVVSGQPSALMALLVGLATVLSLLKTQHFMREVTTVASIPRAGREMATSFKQGVGYMSSTVKSPYKTTEKAVKGYKGVQKGYRKLQTWNEKRVNKSSNDNETNTDKGTSSGKRSRSMASVESAPLKIGETRRASKQGKTDKEGKSK